MQKLGLSKETLRVLDDDVLAGVVGAAKTGKKAKCKKSGRKQKGKGCAR